MKKTKLKVKKKKWMNNKNFIWVYIVLFIIKINFLDIFKILLDY